MLSIILFLLQLFSILFFHVFKIYHYSLNLLSTIKDEIIATFYKIKGFATQFKVAEIKQIILLRVLNNLLNNTKKRIFSFHCVR